MVAFELYGEASLAPGAARSSKLRRIVNLRMHGRLTHEPVNDNPKWSTTGIGVKFHSQNFILFISKFTVIQESSELVRHFDSLTRL